jgi:hypothetical protein
VVERVLCPVLVRRAEELAVLEDALLAAAYRIAAPAPAIL